MYGVCLNWIAIKYHIKNIDIFEIECNALAHWQCHRKRQAGIVCAEVHSKKHKNLCQNSDASIYGLVILGHSACICMYNGKLCRNSLRLPTYLVQLQFCYIYT